jgi:hypothetical protein
VLDQAFIINIPPRKTLLAGSQYIPGEATAIVAPGGTSKTTKLLQDCIGYTLGIDLIEDETPCEPGNALFINMEESRDEIRRKCAGILSHFGLTVDDLKGELFIYTADTLETKLAKRTDRNGAEIVMPQVEQMIDFIKTKEVGFVCCDPFVRFHTVQENDNDQMDVAVKAFMKVARETGVAMGIGHHSNKGHTAGSDNAARGASSFRDACRIVLTMTQMSEVEAKGLLVEDEAYRYVALDGAKANYTVKAGRTWYERISAPFIDGNSDAESSVPVLRKCDPFADASAFADLHNQQMRTKLAKWMIDNEKLTLKRNEATEAYQEIDTSSIGDVPGQNKAAAGVIKTLPELGKAYRVVVGGKPIGIVRKKVGQAANSPITISIVDASEVSEGSEE